MSKKQLITNLHQATGLTIADATSVVDGLSGHIVGTLEADGKVTIPGIGSLTVVDRAARIGTNPATGESINIPAKRAIKFKASKALLEAVQ